MGIRINKAIGYGLNDIKTNEDGISDERFNNLNEDWWERIYEDENSENEYLGFLGDKKKFVKVLVDEFGMTEEDAKWDYTDIELDLKMKSDKFFIYDLFDYDRESNDGWMLFYPLANVAKGRFSSWKRHDDTIDYYENRVYKQELESIVVDLQEYGTNGIYPYDGGLILKPGRENKLKNHMPEYFKQKRSNLIDSGHYNMLLGRWDRRSANPVIKDDDLLKHLKEDWSIRIPTTIKAFVYHFKFFKDPKTVYDFKPLLCQWWA